MPGVCYMGEDGQYRWTDQERWDQRFSPLEVVSQKTETFDLDGDDVATFNFTVTKAGETVHFLVQAADLASKAHGRQVARLLQTQADMITEGLHLKEEEFVPDMMGDIVAFHQKFGLEYLGKPRSLHVEKNDGESLTLFDFRSRFMQEELTEYTDEQAKLTEKVEKSDEGGVVKYLDLQLDALCDLMYVALGTAYLQFGKKIFYEAWRRVQTANMAKVRVENPEDSKRGSKFDVVKPKGWTPPTHVDLLEDHAHVIFRMGGELNAGGDRDTQVVPTAQ